MIDSQKSKVYAAENEMGFKNYDERELKTIQEVTRFIQTSLNNVWVRLDFGEFVCEVVKNNIKVIETRKRVWALAYGRSMRIELPCKNWAWNKIVILHELAHIIMWSLYHQSLTSPHGPEFCWVFLRLLRHCGAKNVWALMQRLFELHKVHFFTENPLSNKAACKNNKLSRKEIK